MFNRGVYAHAWLIKRFEFWQYRSQAGVNWGHFKRSGVDFKFQFNSNLLSPMLCLGKIFFARFPPIRFYQDSQFIFTTPVSAVKPARTSWSRVHSLRICPARNPRRGQNWPQSLKWKFSSHFTVPITVCIDLKFELKLFSCYSCVMIFLSWWVRMKLKSSSLNSLLGILTDVVYKHTNITLNVFKVYKIIFPRMVLLPLLRAY